ncbi:MAG: DUF1679 domain-containing protein [Pseudomonadales bacterium]|nr:DUF1679 domain-containing protein [Pseudomonadales bacterium]
MNSDMLTAIFRDRGYLKDTVVKDVQLTSIETTGIASEFFRVQLKYSSADHSLPDHMVIKRPTLTDRGKGEAEVYEHILRPEVSLPILNCYGIVDDDPNKGLNFLFEDLSSSHSQTTWPIIPDLNDCKSAVTALAKIHANWWGRTESIPDIVPVIVAHQDPDHLANYFPKFADYVGEYLSPRHIKTYESIFSNLGSLLEQHITKDKSTLLHTDSHFWNFFYSNDKKMESCVIFDWPLWRTGIGGSDLAYMIALHLYPEHRHRFETAMLDQYWTQLNENGVSYSRMDVQLDYQIGIIIGLLMPVMEFSWGIPPLDWLPKLEKAFGAYFDLNCNQLLEAV